VNLQRWKTVTLWPKVNLHPDTRDCHVLVRHFVMGCLFTSITESACRVSFRLCAQRTLRTRCL